MCRWRESRNGANEKAHPFGWAYFSGVIECLFHPALVGGVVVSGPAEHFGRVAICDVLSERLGVLVGLLKLCGGEAHVFRVSVAATDVKGFVGILGNHLGDLRSQEVTASLVRVDPILSEHVGRVSVFPVHKTMAGVLSDLSTD